MFHDKVDDDGDSIRGDSRSMLFGHCFGDLLILNANDKNMFTETLFKHSTLVTTFYTDTTSKFLCRMKEISSSIYWGTFSCPRGSITCRPPILDSCSSSSSSFLFMLIIIIIAILLMMIILWQSGGRTKCLCNKHPHQLLPPR